MKIETIVALDREIKVVKKAIIDIAKEAHDHAELVLSWAVQDAMGAIENAASVEREDTAKIATELENAADKMVKILRAITAGKSKIETIEHIKSVIVKAQAADAE